MEIVEWDQSFSVGIPELDEDHQRWLEILNDLAKAKDEGKTPEALELILDELVHYTRYHLTHEEYLLDEMDYPDIDDHKAEHASLAAKIVQARHDFENGKTDEVFERTFVMVRDWLIRHILNSDKLYGKYYGTV